MGLLFRPRWPPIKLLAGAECFTSMAECEVIASTGGSVAELRQLSLARASELHEVKELRGLAPEPFSEEFTDEYLAAVLARTHRALKDVLLDQTKVTGLGNIYAAEALFVARAHPFRRASEFPRRRIASLRRAIVEVLGEAVAHGAARNVSLEDVDLSYYGGGVGGRWRVYDREGEPCADCRAPISRVAHAGRSTYFCPRCQKS